MRLHLPPWVLWLLLLFVALVVPDEADAQWGANRSSCSACHDGTRASVPRPDAWHDNHAFADLCSTCHGGHGDAEDVDDAHVGLVDPLASPDAQCGSCHGADTAALVRLCLTKNRCGMIMQPSSNGGGAHRRDEGRRPCHRSALGRRARLARPDRETCAVGPRCNRRHARGPGGADAVPQARRASSTLHRCGTSGRRGHASRPRTARHGPRAASPALVAPPPNRPRMAAATTGCTRAVQRAQTPASARQDATPESSYAPPRSSRSADACG